MNQHGFTLPELLISIVLTTLITLVVGGFMLDAMQQSAGASLRTSMLTESAQSLDLAANDVRLSSNADQNNRLPDANSPGGAANLYGWSSSANTLVLASAAQDATNKIIFLDLSNYISQKNNIIYFVSNGTLYKRTLAAAVSGNKAKTTCPKSKATALCPADKELLHNVSGFNVSYLDNQNATVSPTNARSIELKVNLSKKFYRKPITAEYTTRMVFRND